MGADAPPPMGSLNYEVMYAVEDRHWWFVGRRAIVTAKIEEALAAAPDGSSTAAAEARQVLDVGCGTGANLGYLGRFGATQGVDLSELALGYCRQRGHRRVLRARARQLPFADDTFDLVTALDVIEHLNDDLAGLIEIRRVLRPGAPAVIFVPAFPALWGPNDDQVNHRRRYRLSGLRSQIEKAELRVEHISYANVLMFFPIWAGRRIMNALGIQSHPENLINHPLVNRIVARLFASEAVWLRRHSLPFGVSIVCLARKRD